MARMSCWAQRFAVAALLAGCASTQTLLVKRFAKENSCQADAVMVHDRGSNTYVAEGCGKRVEYVCPTFIGDGKSAASCAERGINPNTSPQGPPRPVYTNMQEPPR